MTARSPCRWCGPSIEVLDDWRPPVDGIVVVESRPARRWSATWPRASRYLGVPVTGRYAIVDASRRRPGAARSTRRSASQP